ncbi:MAG: peptide-methionine (S)-S-oxide reductase MsrA [Planctomycetota bacterium]
MRNLKIQLVLVLILCFGIGWEKGVAAVPNERKSAPAHKPRIQDLQRATFAGGCFWGIEHNFRRIPGVEKTAVGFMGGRTKNPSYREICYTNTNHAEVVHLAFDPNEVSYEQLVRIFFIMHDPTTLNRQGPDVGTQYRSAIFYHDDTQKQTAQKVKAELTKAKAFRRPIVTEIAAAKEFWIAEDYHQQYIEKNPLRSCHLVDFKKVQKILDDD